MKRFGILFMAGLLAISLAGFGGGGIFIKQAAAAEDTAAADSIEGFWKIVRIEAGEESTTEEQIAQMEEMGMAFFMIITADGSLTVSYYGEEGGGSWDDATISFGENTFTYTLDGDTLSFGQDDIVMTFGRTTAEELESIVGVLPGASAMDGILDPDVTYSQEEQVILDSENATVTIIGYEPFSPTGFAVHILCENKSDRRLLFSADTMCVNKYMISPMWAADTQGGDMLDQKLVIGPEDLSRCGITSVDEFILGIQVMDPEEYTVVGEGQAAVYPTGKAAGDIPAPVHTPQDGEVMIVDNESCTFSILGIEEDPVMGKTLWCFLNNKTDHPLTYMWDDVTVNGAEVITFFAEKLLPGSACYGYAFFSSSSMEEKGVADITDVQAVLSVYDMTEGIEELVNEAFSYTP